MNATDRQTRNTLITILSRPPNSGYVKTDISLSRGCSGDSCGGNKLSWNGHADITAKRAAYGLPTYVWRNFPTCSIHIRDWWKRRAADGDCVSRKMQRHVNNWIGTVDSSTHSWCLSHMLLKLKWKSLQQRQARKYRVPVDVSDPKQSCLPSCCRLTRTGSNFHSVPECLKRNMCRSRSTHHAQPNLSSRNPSAENSTCRKFASCLSRLIWEVNLFSSLMTTAPLPV